MARTTRGRVGEQPHRTAAHRAEVGRTGQGSKPKQGAGHPTGYGNSGTPGSKGSAWYNKHHGKKKPLAGNHYAHGNHPPKQYRPGHGWYHQRHGHYYPVHRSPRYGWWYHRYRPAPVWGWYYPVILPWHRYYYVYYGPNPWWLGYPVIIYEETVIVSEPEVEEEIIEWYEVPGESAWDDYSEYDSPDATWDTGASEWVEVEGGQSFDEGDEGWEVVEKEEGWYDPETGQVFDTLPADAVESELTPEDTVPQRIADGTGDFSDSMETQIADLINEERAAQGLKPLTTDPRLVNAARQHSREMNDLEYFSHQSPNEEFGTLTRRLGKAGMKRYGWAGENIAMSSSASPRDFVKMWMDSPGHRENILRAQFQFTGIGVYGDGETFYATQVFSSQR